MPKASLSVDRLYMLLQLAVRLRLLLLFALYSDEVLLLVSRPAWLLSFVDLLIYLEIGHRLVHSVLVEHRTLLLLPIHKAISELRDQALALLGHILRLLLTMVGLRPMIRRLFYHFRIASLTLISVDRNWLLIVLVRALRCLVRLRHSSVLRPCLLAVMPCVLARLSLLLPVDRLLVANSFAHHDRRC